MEVTTKEQTEELLALGLPPSKAGCSWEMMNARLGTMRLTANSVTEYGISVGCIPAFTVEDLIDLLPKTFKDGIGIRYNLIISPTDNEVWYWMHDYDCREISFTEPTLISSLCAMVSWVYWNEDNYKLELPWKTT